MFEDAGRKAGQAAFEKSHEWYDGGRDVAMSFAHSVEDYVRQQPIRSILITVGVVCLFTAAFVRR
jgi:hypothetical protein